MSSKHLGNDEFLTRLTTLLSTTHTTTHGSIYLTQKPLPETPSSTLIRATNGKSKVHRKPGADSPKVKLSTVVKEGDLLVFYGKYAEVCKKGMEGMRKRDKKKAKARQKKKKTGGEKAA